MERRTDKIELELCRLRNSHKDVHVTLSPSSVSFMNNTLKCMNGYSVHDYWRTKVFWPGFSNSLDMIRSRTHSHSFIHSQWRRQDLPRRKGWVSRPEVPSSSFPGAKRLLLERGSASTHNTTTQLNWKSIYSNLLNTVIVQLIVFVFLLLFMLMSDCFF